MMKKLYLMSLCLLVAFSAMALDRLYINDFSISPGETKQVEIMLYNETSFSAIQADIFLPNGLTIEQEDGDYLFELTDRKGRDHTVSSRMLSSGAIRIVIASQSLKVFSGNSGALVTFNITADASFNESQTIEINNVIASEVNQTQHNFPATSCTVTVDTPPGSNDRLYINDFGISAGETKQVQLMLDNELPYTALQADIYLPQGLTIEKENGEYLFELTNRKGSDHTIASTKLSNGAIRIVILSQSLQEFSGNSGAIVTFNISADASFTETEVIELKRILVSEENQAQHALPDTTCTVTYEGNIIPLGINDRLYINDFGISAGETKQVQLMLDNELPYTALQADIYLPQGLTIEKENGEYLFELTNRKGSDHTIASTKLSNGAIRIVILSQSLQEFSGNSGAIVTFNISADASFTETEAIELKRILVSEENQAQHALPDTTCTVTYEGNIIPLGINDRLYINDFGISAGETKQVQLMLDNELPYTALQADIYLPQGLTIEKENGEYLFELTNRKGSDHTIASTKLSNGAIRVVILSQSLQEFSGNSGAIVTFNISADASFTETEVIELKRILVSEENQAQHALPDTTCTVTYEGSIIPNGSNDRFYINDFSIWPGQTKQVEIMLDNELPYTALQADIYLPEGLTVEQENGEYLFELTNRKGSSHNIASTQLTNGAIRIVVLSQSLQEFSGDSGALVRFNITATPSFGNGGVIELKRILTSEVNQVQHALPDTICTVTRDAGIPATGITLNNTSLTLLVGSTQTLMATVTPSNVTVSRVSWSSSNPSVATVDANGNVTAVSPGAATISATTVDGTNLTASCQVNVYNIATSISLNTTNMTLYVGVSDSLLTATISPSNSLSAQYPLQWTSSNANVASVNGTGMVTPRSNGTAIITVSTTDGTNLSATCQVTVKTHVGSITLDKHNVIMYKNDTNILTATISPETASDKNVYWSSSNNSIVSVNNNGNITAKAVGIAYIYAISAENHQIKDSCLVEVYNRVSSVTLNYSSLILEVGDTQAITATVAPSNAYNKTLAWTSSNPSVAQVDDNGVITAISVGNAVISATTTDGSNITASCDVEVITYATDVIINKHETSIYVGGTEQLTAQVLPENAYNKTVTWSSSDNTIASVNANGLVTAKKIGSAYIKANCDGLVDSCLVNVVGITSLTLDEHELSIDIESIDTLHVVIEPNDVINQVLRWRSLNTSVATVSNQGVVTPTGLGSTTIIVEATDGSGASDSCHVTVTPAYDLYPLTTELSHVRGDAVTSVIIPFWLSNKSPVSGLQFDITLPAGVTFATIDGDPDAWLDANRKARNHTINVNMISNSQYRVLVSSPTNQTFKGNEGVVLYLRMEIDRIHPIGTYYITSSNVIFVEPNETQHTGSGKSTKIDYKYLLGDADCDARVDIADYTVTALEILNHHPETFYSDAADVSADNLINVADLVGITNISLGIRDHEYRPAPAISLRNEVTESAPSLYASSEGDNIVNISIDNDMPIAGLQLDIQLPQGMTIAEAMLEGRAANYQLGMNSLNDGSVRLLISSFGNKDIVSGDDAIIKLFIDGDNANNEMLYISGASAASRDLMSYYIQDVSLPMGTTSLNDVAHSYDKLSVYGNGNTIVVNTPNDMTIQVVHINGMVMPVDIKSGHNTIDVGGHGIYIIRAGNSVYKVRL